MRPRREILTTVSRTIQADPARVFAQLADGWIYGTWVVGASHIRDVDVTWPEVGSKLHHRVGPWPLSVNDMTEVVEKVPERRLVLRAKAWPVGQARVELTLAPSGQGCVVTMAEAPVKGLGAVLDNPALRAVLKARNAESLARLDDLATHRPGPTPRADRR